MDDPLAMSSTKPCEMCGTAQYGHFLKMTLVPYSLVAIIIANLGVYWKIYENIDHLYNFIINT